MSAGAGVSANSSRGSIRRRLMGILLDWDRVQMAFCFLLVGLLAVMPLFVRSPYYLGIIILATIYIFIGISWNIIAGFSGQLLIAHIIFLAVGAYTTIILLNRYNISPWVGILVAGLIAALCGIVIAFITLRYGLKMDYFALFTIALMVALRTLFLKWDYVGGAVGMWVSLANPSWDRMVFPTKEPYLYIGIVLVVIGLLIQYRIYRSKMGKYFLAIREDDDAAAALGVNTSLYRTLAVVIGAAMAGVGGGFYVMYVTFIEPPQVFNLGLNVEIVMAGPIIGGLGSIAGPVLGALLNKPFVEILRGLLAEERSGTTLIVYGSFLIITILFLPRGLAGILHTLYIRLLRRFGV
ncbi:MAG: branched-chain amino acid ABC transporter permease [Candidatus Promineifilaceae bacterium]|nr:branched-chain amino acid ABC transporter permease [Candidatus Promineifilaceae bacterium]